MISTKMSQVCAVFETANVLGVARSRGHLRFEADMFLRMQTADRKGWVQAARVYR